MPLSIGDKIGHYEVLSLLGQGGMGEVYRARDTKLKREVAIKVLPEAFARDSERMARFQREAEVLASLNHPNIATIHGVEDRALVMELVQGNSPKGPLPFDEAWKIASQIAAALEYAHDRGIMHRDLKPANIIVTPDGVVKLLDFGLAKAFSNQREPSSSPENSPTLTLDATQVGVILGTAAYMAPEQAKGKSVDQRADIWSFAVVLYELLTGERLFKGDDVSEILAGVIKEKPDFSKVPERARPMLQRCLEKDPRNRLRDIADLDLLLGQEVVRAPALLAQAKGTRYWAWPAAAALFAILAGVALWQPWRKLLAPPEVVKFEIFPPEKTTLGKFAVSPDGRKIAFYVEGSGLWVRSLDSADSRLIASSTAAGIPTFFWSYDSRYVAFPRGDNLNALMKVDLTGAPPQTVCEIKSIVVGGSWNRDGTILFGSVAPGGVWRVSAAGGAASPVTVSDPSRHDQAHFSPVFLPDGKHFVYLRLSGAPENTGIYVGSLDTKPEQQTSKRLVATNFNPVIAISSNPGSVLLLFLRENALLAQPLDLAKLEMTGEPARIAAGIGNQIEFGNFGASNNGVLAYRTGSATGNAIRRLTWLDRAGTSLSEVGTDYYSSLKLAPDTSRVAATRIDTSPNNIWLFDFARKTPTRLTAGSAYDADPAWSPDGAQVAYVSLKSGMGLYRRLSNGSGDEEMLLPPGGDARELDDWSHDGRFLIYSEVNSKTKADLWILPMAPQKPGEARQPAVYLNSEFNETEGQFSPNGRWIAYVSDESGRSEVYIQPFPLGAGGDGKVRVSSGGGLMPRWRRDGKELFFVVNSGDVMAGDVADTPSLKVGIPKRLFNTIVVTINPNNFTWDVAPDGKRFLVESSENQEKGAPSPITVVLNWQAEIKK